MMNLRQLIFLAAVVGLAFFRILPHPPNFTPVLAMALFAGTFVSGRSLHERLPNYLLPILALVLSDAFIGFHWLSPVVYLIYGGVAWLGSYNKTEDGVDYVKVVAGVVASPIAFFLVSNFAVWLQGALYPRTMTGLLECYTLAIPFFGYTLMSTFIYSMILFGGHFVIERWAQQLKQAA